jgi:WD40 repeat protein
MRGGGVTPCILERAEAGTSRGPQLGDWAGQRASPPPQEQTFPRKPSWHTSTRLMVVGLSYPATSASAGPPKATGVCVRAAPPGLSWSYETLQLLDAATGRQIGSAMKHEGGVNFENGVIGALLTKDETRILSWSRDWTVRLWDAATGRQIGPAMKHDDGVWGALLTKDEKRILSWSYDKTVRLWDAATGRQMLPAMKHEHWVNGALLTKDDKRILSWSYDGTMRLWDAATG